MLFHFCGLVKTLEIASFFQLNFYSEWTRHTSHTCTPPNYAIKGFCSPHTLLATVVQVWMETKANQVQTGEALSSQQQKQRKKWLFERNAFMRCTHTVGGTYYKKGRCTWSGVWCLSHLLGYIRDCVFTQMICKTTQFRAFWIQFIDMDVSHAIGADSKSWMIFLKIG